MPGNLLAWFQRLPTGRRAWPQPPKRRPTRPEFLVLEKRRSIADQLAGPVSLYWLSGAQGLAALETSLDAPLPFAVERAPAPAIPPAGTGPALLPPTIPPPPVHVGSNSARVLQQDLVPLPEMSAALAA